MIFRREDHTGLRFLKRTIAAQIHFVTALLAIVGVFFLAPRAGMQGATHFWSAIIFCATATLVFGVSAAYHFLHDGYRIAPELADFLEKLDQWTIYLFIAGTYTPFLITAVESPWREILMILIWTMAFSGILYTGYRHRLPRWAQSRLIYTSGFLLMGWTLCLRMGEIFERLSPLSRQFLLAGVIAYSVGAVLYATRWPRLFGETFGFHELWHACATIGFLCHFAMIASFYV